MRVPTLFNLVTFFCARRRPLQMTPSDRATAPEEQRTKNGSRVFMVYVDILPKTGIVRPIFTPITPVAQLQGIHELGN